jgi:hypothetical protein
MSKFPVESQDTAGITDSLNYVLSGPGSLGQPAQGFNSSSAVYITGNERLPYVSTALSKLYVAPISLGSSVWLDDFTWQYNFASAQPSAPFTIGNNVTVAGVTPSAYNYYYDDIGVVACTTTYVIVRSAISRPNPGSAGTGGTVSLGVLVFNSPAIDGTANVTLTTDCSGIVSVIGGQQNVNVSAFITARGTDDMAYTVTTAGLIDFTVQLNRYKANNLGNYIFDVTVAEQVNHLNFASITAPILVDTAFPTILDSPGPGQYLYALELKFIPTSSSINITINNIQVGRRNLTAQVIKT